MTEFHECHRLATVVLVDLNNQPLGQLKPIRLSTPWFQEIAELVQLVRNQHGIDIVILRLLETDESALPEIKVSYLAEIDRSTASSIELSLWQGRLTEDPLRLSYAKSGGPDRDLAWAKQLLIDRGHGQVITQRQVRTWNLSSIWQLDTSNEIFWLKCVPPFLGHEPDILRLFSREKVPQLVGSDNQRMLLKHLPGEDCYDASPVQMLHMISVLVDLQWRWSDRTSELKQAGLPEYSDRYLQEQIPRIIDQYWNDLDEPQQAALDQFKDDLPSRLLRLAGCGVPNTLVHGDYHPGNWRGTGLDLTVLDWGDCFIGNPFLDQPALIDRGGDHVSKLLAHWASCWQEKLPDADVTLASDLVAPIAAARMAVLFQRFLDNIEPSERIYHDTDPILLLRKTADILLK
jgi:hypothetical protein